VRRGQLRAPANAGRTRPSWTEDSYARGFALPPKLESHRKLTLKSDTVKTLKAGELAQAVGGVTIGMTCHQPTTTVQHTFDC
jgi:hypothetical protein